MESKRKHKALEDEIAQASAGQRAHRREVIEKLKSGMNAALGGPRLREQLADLGAEPFAISPDEFGKFTVEYTQKWAKVIRAAYIKAE